MPRRTSRSRFCGHGPTLATRRVRRVEVRLVRHAEVGAGLHERVVDGIPVTLDVAADGDRPGVAVERIRAEVEVVLELDEVGKHVLPAPARVAEGGPAVEVEWRSSNGDAAVHHRRAADELAPSEAHAVAVRERLVPVAPVQLGDPGGEPVLAAADHEQRRQLLLVREVGAGLEEQHPPILVLGEPDCDDTAARARAYDDDVEVLHGGRLAQAVGSGSRTTPPGLAPVARPSFQTAWPATQTPSTPSGGRIGSS